MPKFCGWNNNLAENQKCHHKLAKIVSLTGYVARLAQQHCITTRRLILNEIATYLGLCTEFSDYQTQNISHIIGIDRHRTALNGTGLMAKNLVGALSALTRNTNLHFLTLLTWRQVFPNRGLLRHQRAWCPNCYQEWRNNDKSIYEPLLWSINAVVICPTHHNCLLEQCPYSHQSMTIISGNSVPGHCNKCGHWLGSSGIKKFCLAIKTTAIYIDIFLISLAPSQSAIKNIQLQVVSKKGSAYAKKFLILLNCFTTKDTSLPHLGLLSFSKSHELY